MAQGMARFDAQVLAYCLMGNHYHLVLHTRRANLSALMRHVNGVLYAGIQSPARQGGAPVSRPLQGHFGGPRGLLA